MHYLKTIRAESIRILIVLGTIFGFDLALGDWQLEHVQAKLHLLRKALNPPPEFLQGVNELVHVKRPIYGLPNSSKPFTIPLLIHSIHDRSGS